MSIEKKRKHRLQSPMVRMQRNYFLKTMAMFFLPILLLVVVIGGVSVGVAQIYVKNVIDSQNRLQLTRISSTIDSQFEELDQLNAFLSNNPAIKLRLRQAVLKMDENHGLAFDDYAVVNSIIEMIYVSVGTNSNIDSMYLYFDNEAGWFISNNRFLMLSEYFDTEWEKEYRNHNSEERVWFEFRTIDKYQFRQDEKKDVFTIYSKIYSSAKSKPDGVLVLNVDLKSLESSSASFLLNDQSIIRLTTQDGKTIIQSREIFANPKYSIYSTNSSVYDWNYEYLIPESSNYLIPNMVMRIILILCIIAIVVGFLVSFSESKQNFSRIMELVKIITLAKEGKDIPNYDNTSSDLFNYVMQNVVRSFIQVDYLHIQLLEKQYHAEAQELAALRSQLNPHFLYNTFQTILWKTISITGKPNDASKMMDMLSDILHYSLDENGGTTNLCEEIRITEAYLSLQKIRYRNRLLSTWDVCDLQTEATLFPKLIFQPLIENSIVHGMKDSGEILRLRIEIKKTKNRELKIRIIDNGIGMGKNQLHAIRKQISKCENQKQHVGLFNTYRRLQLLFVNQSRFYICSSERKGTIITFFIPYHQELKNCPKKVGTS